MSARSILTVRPSTIGAAVLAAVLAGCATQSDLLRQERKLTEMMQEQSRSMDDMRRQLERLREDLGPGARTPGRSPTAKVPRKPSSGTATATPPPAPLPHDAPIGMTPSPDGTSTDDPAQAGTAVTGLSAPAPAPEAPPAEGTATAPPPPAEAASPSAAPQPVNEDWRREVAQERAVASASGAPERAQYVAALERVEKGDCAKMKALAGGGSQLSDNATYWQGKCLAARGDQRKAEARLNEVVARYPKSDKAPAALWERGQIQLRSGNQAAARATLARLVRDYPASAEATRARKKLAELPN